MRVIGLTGGIASGKSLVSQQLAERGAVIIDADKVGWETYRQGTETYRVVVDAFGPEVVGADGEIDRRVLGAKVFADPEARRRLEEIVWPAIRRLTEERLSELRAEGVAAAVLEAAVLIEANWLDLVDEVWLVTVSPETARQRLVERNGLAPEQAGYWHDTGHAEVLHRLGFVARRKEGTHVFYRVDDPDVFSLCDLVCGGARERLRKDSQTLRAGGR